MVSALVAVAVTSFLKLLIKEVRLQKYCRNYWFAWIFFHSDFTQSPIFPCGSPSLKGCRLGFARRAKPGQSEKCPWRGGGGGTQGETDASTLFRTGTFYPISPSDLLGIENGGPSTARRYDVYNGHLSNYGGNANENVTQKTNFTFLKVLRNYLI